MKKFKGTKGPWFFNGREIESVECAYIADVNGTDASPDEECCNSRLIAAAPDLLEELIITLGALKEVCFTCGASRPESTIRRAEAAIAKALGETK